MFLHHYLQKGFTLEYLNNVSISDKNVMTASMLYEIEEKGKLWGALLG